MTSAVVSQELVVHAFVLVEPPHAESGRNWVRELWSACRERLGLTKPVPVLKLPSTLPEDLDLGPRTGVIAVQQGERGQAVLRRLDDVLNLSVGLVGRPDAGWIGLDRSWTGVAPAPSTAVVGLTRLYLGLLPAEAALDGDHHLRPMLPAPYRSWWPAEWTGLGPAALLGELSGGSDTEIERRFVAIARVTDEAELSRWVWSGGHPDLPPLARHVMHASKLRYQVRVWDGGGPTRRVRDAANAAVALLGDAMEQVAETGSGATYAALSRQLTELQASRGELVRTLGALRDMGHTVEVISAGLSQGGLLPKDLRLASWFADQLDHEARYLDSTMASADGIAAVAAEALAARPAPPAQVRDRPKPSGLRLGFAVDIIEYGRRQEPDRGLIQTRLRELATAMIRGAGADPDDTHVEAAGDGIMAFLPLGDPTDMLARLLSAAPDLIRADNAVYRDRIRMRMSVAIGTFRPGATGVVGSLPVELSRLESSRPLRRAADQHASSDLVVLVSRRLHEDVVKPGYLRRLPIVFQRTEVVAKEYRQPAWLWPAPPPA